MRKEIIHHGKEIKPKLIFSYHYFRCKGTDGYRFVSHKTWSLWIKLSLLSLVLLIDDN